MEFSKFTLGLRFAVTSDSALTPKDCWNILFSETPLTYIVETRLFGAWSDLSAAESERAYVCMFSNLPLNTGKALYAQLLRKPKLLSHLTIYRPFIQNNLVEKCGKTEYLGKVNYSGTVSDGEVVYGCMRFTGAEPQSCEKTVTCPRILIAPDAWEGKFTSADAVRHMMRSAAAQFPHASIKSQLIADGGHGTLDALVCSVKGRYLSAALDTGDGKAINLRYGILPDETVVFESESLTKKQFALALSLPQNRGYRNYIVAAGSGFLPETVPEGIRATVLGKRIPANQRNSSRIEYRSGVETVLELSEFDFRLGRVDWLIVLTRMRDKSASLQDATTDTLLFHCRSLNKRAAVLAFDGKGRFYAKLNASPPVPLASVDFDQAADELFQKIRQSSGMPAFTGPVMPDTIHNEM
jgi:hypothetical protein